MKKYIHEFKAGDLVAAHGGVFRIIQAAKESQAHRPDYWTSDKGRITLAGPCDCAYAPAICIEGSVPGYFKPGSAWDFQGNFKGGKYTVLN